MPGNVLAQTLVGGIFFFFASLDFLRDTLTDIGGKGGQSREGILARSTVLLTYFCLTSMPPPLSLKSPSFEDRKRLGMAQHRKGGNFKSKSRYSSLYFLTQDYFFPALFPLLVIV